eukprot:1428223-Pleurochrysis_carterae.AAC.2
MKYFILNTNRAGVRGARGAPDLAVRAAVRRAVVRRAAVAMRDRMCPRETHEDSLGVYRGTGTLRNLWAHLHVGGIERRSTHAYRWEYIVLAIGDMLNIWSMFFSVLIGQIHFGTHFGHEKHFQGGSCALSMNGCYSLCTTCIIRQSRGPTALKLLNAPTSGVIWQEEA